MKKATIEKGKICPKCKKQENQIKSFASKQETTICYGGCVC